MMTGGNWARWLRNGRDPREWFSNDLTKRGGHVLERAGGELNPCRRNDVDPPGSLVKCYRLKATTGVRGVSVSICASTHSLFKHIVDRSDLGDTVVRQYIRGAHNE